MRREPLRPCRGTGLSQHLDRAPAAGHRLVSWLGQLPLLGSVPRLEGLALAAGRSAATAAGTAIGVGALALTGVMGAGNTAASDGGNVGVSQGARATAPAHGAWSRSVRRFHVGSVTGPVPRRPCGLRSK